MCNVMEYGTIRAITRQIESCRLNEQYGRFRISTRRYQNKGQDLTSSCYYKILRNEM